MTTKSDYLVKDARLVIDHLNELIRNKCLIHAHFGDQKATFLTTIISIDPENKRLFLDCGPTEALDKQLLASNKVLFRTEVDGIKISFGGKDIKKIKTGTESVFSLPIPNTIFWLQRRQFYRVRIPFSHKKSYCQLTINTPNSKGGEIITFQLHDLSINGFSFLNSDPNLTGYLHPDNEFTNCTLHLNNDSQAVVDFVIKNHVKTPNNPHNTQDRIGCLIHGVSPTFEASIQRYMHDIQLQQKNIG